MCDSYEDIQPATACELFFYKWFWTFALFKTGDNFELLKSLNLVGGSRTSTAVEKLEGNWGINFAVDKALRKLWARKEKEKENVNEGNHKKRQQQQ